MPATKSPDLTNDFRSSHMLIPLDGTPLAEDILESADGAGQGDGIRVSRCLQAVTPVYPVTLPAEPAVFGSVATEMMERVEKMHGELKKNARLYLETIANRLRGNGPQGADAGERRGAAGRRRFSTPPSRRST